ncbi:hypothetical protein N7535_001956 [Penicillium sp. DV-2018c]|nr:hypothetical protein N7461_004800 [Penicillium sp. DV-2018c]KAJ5583336.1 hypothetical protein N7535_001956 [Penicillium sp. DV-2018c]
MEPHSNPLPSLLVLIYVGHDTVDTTTGKMGLVAGAARQNIQWPLIHNSFFSHINLTTKVDTLGILSAAASSTTYYDLVLARSKVRWSPFMTIKIINGKITVVKDPFGSLVDLQRRASALFYQQLKAFQATPR